MQETPERPDVSSRAVRQTALYGALHLVFWQVAPRVRDERLVSVLVATVIALVLAVLVTASAARSMRSLRSVLAVACVSAAIVVPVRVLYAWGRVVPPWGWVLAVPGASELAFMLLGASIGVLLGRLLRSANMIPPAAGALALVDVYTVLLGGPVQQVLHSSTEAARRVTEVMTAKLPTPTTGAAPIVVVGFADFVFMAFFVSAMCRFLGDRIGYGKTVGPLAVILSLYMGVVLLTGWSLPALVPMAAVVLIRHWRRFEYSRSERFALLYAGLIALAVLGAAVWLTR